MSRANFWPMSGLAIELLLLARGGLLSPAAPAAAALSLKPSGIGRSARLRVTVVANGSLSTRRSA